MNFPPDSDEGCTLWDFLTEAGKSLGLAVAGAVTTAALLAGGFELVRLL